MTELLTNFEVNREPRWPILLRLIGASMVLHIALAASVLYVPTFRDALNIALLAGQANYVDRPYNKTVIGDEVQMVAVGPKFHYPDGYFATGFPSGVAAPTPDPLAPKIISTFTPPKPEGTPAPIPSPLASPAAAAAASPAVAASKAGNTPTPAEAAASGKTDSTTDGKKIDDEVLGIKEDEINTRPLKDWLARANALKEKGVLDLNADLEMTIDASLTGDCKLGDPKVVQKSGDRQMVELAKDLAGAISESRMLLFLKDPAKVQQEKALKSLRCDPMALRFSVKLDQSDFNATVETEADSTDRAAQLTRLYNFALAAGEINKRGRDEEVIFKNTKVTAQGKQIIVHFKMPRTPAAEILKKQIEPKPAS
jgi:hypothetical protein